VASKPKPAPSANGARRGDTAARILDSAEQLVQMRGFNAFSYADVAGELGITTASLHYHFPGKAELGLALIARYSERFNDALAEIDRSVAGAPAKLRAYAELYADVLRAERMCLCGMLAAEFGTLPAPIRDGIVAFFDDNERWLARVLDEGRSERSLVFEGSPTDTARVVISSLEGAMLVARPYGDLTRFQTAAGTLVAGLAAPGR
jgi:TetR/AcrR family transcriptional regulator, transcriptional repressor for nem operon